MKPFAGLVGSRVKFKEFFGACSEKEHHQTYTIEGDHPEVRCGTDNAPTPAELLLGALSACLTAGIGKVREVVADGRGQIEQVVIAAKEVRSVIPASDLAVSGNDRILAEGEGSVMQSSPEEVSAE